MKISKTSYKSYFSGEEKLVLGILFLGWLLSLANTLYYYYEIVLPNYNWMPDFIFFLFRGRVWVTFALAFLAVGIFVRRLAGKILGIFSTIFIFNFYILWYFDKFRWLEVQGIYEGSENYPKALSQIGLFRGANDIDYLVIILTICLFFWILLRYKSGRGRVEKLA